MQPPRSAAVIAALSSALLASFVLEIQPAAAQQRFCIVDEARGQVYCGRPANDSEIFQAGQQTQNRNGGFGNGGSGHGSWGGGGFGNDRNADENLRRSLNELYEDILGRRADRNGLNTYARKLQSGWNLGRVRQDLAESNEAGDRINDLYRRVLNRDADAGGLKTYRRRLAKDWSLQDVEQDIRQSDEARRVQGR